MKTIAHIHSVEVLSNETMFNVQVSKGGVTGMKSLTAVDMEKLIKGSNVEVTYNEDFARKDDSTIDQIIDNLDMTHAEVTDFETDGEFDVYIHKVSANHGEVSYDGAGEFIGSYKTEKTANKKALKLANKIGY